MPPHPSPETIQQLWTLTLIAFAIVLVAVAVLLTLVLRAARDIRSGVAAIWNAGQRIANNTVHIALLERTNATAGRILEAAGGVLGATAAIRRHAEQCAGCPECVLGPRWAR